ncbi:LysR family transcriptional regulator [uncultured Propionivibrio sp.]|uniref:LysR family transcriptional regulator n=1 Tax=uncultured Propionivibrio sp. TaxID=426737 RepID=UPI0029C05E56|nr:LysR family transcriptional regulator [uncultured Propionivibrio sp.]
MQRLQKPPKLAPSLDGSAVGDLSLETFRLLPVCASFATVMRDVSRKRLLEMTQLDQQLRYFVAISEAGSFSGAADQLGLSQPALSRQLSKLEEYLQQSLFMRTGRGVVLTRAGKTLYETVQRAFGSIDETVNALRSECNEIAGQVRIATVHTLSHYFLPQLIRHFSQTYPRANCFIAGRSSPDVVDMVRTGKADIGFVYDVAVTADGLQIYRLFEEQMCLFAHEDTRLDRGPQLDLSSTPLVTFPETYALRQMLIRAGLAKNVVAEVETVDTMLRLVACKLGVCILPDRIPDSEIQQLHLTRVALDSLGLRRHVVCITRANSTLTPVTSALVRIAQSFDSLIGETEDASDF